MLLCSGTVRPLSLDDPIPRRLLGIIKKRELFPDAAKDKLG